MSLPVEMETCTHALNPGVSTPTVILLVVLVLVFVIYVMTSFYRCTRYHVVITHQILRLYNKQKNKETRKK